MKSIKNIQQKWHGYIYCILLTSFIGFASCDDEMKNSTYATTSIPMIDEYMEDPQNNLTDFLSLVDKADYRGMLHAYGTYTCFVPTNAAVQDYLNQSGLQLETITKEQALELVGYHLVIDTLSTSTFVDGRLESPNIRKQYLTTRTLIDEKGDVYIEVNRQAKIINKDVVLGNGYIHVVDHFMTLASKTVAETIESMPDAEFSIMKQLIKDTNFDDVLNQTGEEKFYTFFMQSNQVFEDLKIADRASLLQRLRENTPEIAKDEDLLLNFVWYHCAPERKYISDLMMSTAVQTYGSTNVLAFSMTKEYLLINEFKVGELNEEGVEVDRNSEYSDLTCLNGVVHQVLGQVEVRKRKPYRVYWDFADQPEIRSLKSFRKPGFTNTGFKEGELSEMTWSGSNNPTLTYIPYYGYQAKYAYTYGDYVTMRIATNVMQWCEIKTPLLIEGTYNIWLCYRISGTATFRVTFKQEGAEDQILPSVANLTQTGPTAYYTDATKTNIDHDKMVQEGHKQYPAKTYNGSMVSKLLGTVKVNSTGRHILRFDALSTGSNMNYDLIQYIPVDEDQTFPMIAWDGAMIEKGTPDCQIYPDDGTNCPDVE